MNKPQKQEQFGKSEDKNKSQEKMLISEVKLIRVLGKDIPGDKKILVGLTNLKGISWAFSNAICKRTNINPDKIIENLSEEEIRKITEFVKNPRLPVFLMNRRKDYHQGNDKHLIGSDLDLQKDFDIKRLKKIKAYKGIRHMQGQPVRGQRTKSHFRSNRKKGGSVGVTKSKQAKTVQSKPAGKK
jgi:small subunit ribosomal protein S13